MVALHRTLMLLALLPRKSALPNKDLQHNHTCLPLLLAPPPQAAWAVGNIAGDSVPLRDKCIAAGASRALQCLLERDAVEPAAQAGKAQLEVGSQFKFSVAQPARLSRHDSAQQYITCSNP